MDVSFSVWWEEEHPILFDGRASGGWVASELGECWIGFQGPISDRGLGGG